MHLGLMLVSNIWNIWERMGPRGERVRDKGGD
jgi:hypothetical protein